MMRLFETIGKIIFILILVLGLMEIVARYAPTGLKFNILTYSKTPKNLPDNWDKEKYNRLREDSINAVGASDDFLGYYFKPYSSKTLNLIAEHGITKRLSWAYSTSPNTNAIQDIDIYFFGGSTMFGQGVSDFETIPSFVSRILYSKYNIKANVHNFARMAYVSTEEFLLFSYLAPKIKNKKIAIAIFLSGLNEIVSVDFFVPPNLDRKMGNSIIARIKIQSASFTRHSRLMNALGSFVANNNAASKVSLSDQDEIEVENNYKRNITNIISVAKDNNIIPLFYWQPLNCYKKVKTSYEQNTQYVPEIEYRKVIDFPENNFHNISHLFEDTREPIFIDFGHYNEYGHKLIAERIANDIVKIVKSRLNM